MTDLTFCPAIQSFVADHRARCGADAVRLRAGLPVAQARSYVVTASCSCGAEERERLRGDNLEAWLRGRSAALAS